MRLRYADECIDLGLRSRLSRLSCGFSFDGGITLSCGGVSETAGY